MAHVGENLLVPLRDGELTLNNQIADALLGMVDAIRQILTSVETTGVEGDKQYDALIKQLEAATTSGAPVSPVADSTQTPLEEGSGSETTVAPETNAAKDDQSVPQSQEENRKRTGNPSRRRQNQ